MYVQDVWSICKKTSEGAMFPWFPGFHVRRSRITSHLSVVLRYMSAPSSPATASLYSGRPAKKDSKYIGTPKTAEEEREFFKKICRGEPTTRPGDPSKNPKLEKFMPVFRHPLPLSENRPSHELMLRRILCMDIRKQAISAATLGNAWVLEEVYMRGGEVDLPDKSGYTPLHMAVNNNNFECIMVLLNIGVDINATTTNGLTPLYLAKSLGAKEAQKLLEEQGAQMHFEPKSVAPGKTILDLKMKAPNSVIAMGPKACNLPPPYDGI